MRFIHIADIHLGANPDAGKAYQSRRSKELWESLEGVIRDCNRKKINFLFLSGDIFHRQPLLRELKQLNQLFMELLDTKVIMIAGNHDYIKENSYYRTFAWSSHVFFLQKKTLEKVEFPEFDLAVYGRSYHQQQIVEGIDATWKAERKRRCEILLFHGGQENYIPASREELYGLGYDYIAMGHIHKPSGRIEDTVLYAGSLEPTDINDEGEHGYIEGEWTGEKIVTRFVKCCRRQYIPLEVYLKEEMTKYQIQAKIQEKIKEEGVEHLFKIRLKGIKDMEMILEQEDVDVFGNIVEWKDERKPSFDLKQLEQIHQENLLGEYIRYFRGSEEGSMEEQALLEGVYALLGIEER